MWRTLLVSTCIPSVYAIGNHLIQSVVKTICVPVNSAVDDICPTFHGTVVCSVTNTFDFPVGRTGFTVGGTCEHAFNGPILVALGRTVCRSELDTFTGSNQHSIGTAVGQPKLDPDALARCMECIIAKLGDDSEKVRLSALEALGKAGTEVVAAHVGRVLSMLKDNSEYVPCEALEVLVRLEPEVLAKYAARLIAMLDDGDKDVKVQALYTLSRVDSQEVAKWAESA